MSKIIGILILLALFIAHSYIGLYKISGWKLIEIILYWVAVFALTGLVILAAIMIVG